MKRYVCFGLLLALLLMLPASADTDSELTPPVLTPEQKAIGQQIILIGSFWDQIESFRCHYGRVPFSYEEWRDSGFLLFTPWTGLGLIPAKHVDRTPSVETDSYGTFHYQYIGPSSYKLELLCFVSEGLEVLSWEHDLSGIFSHGTGFTYMEAKADAYSNLLQLLWCRNMDYLGREPSTLLEAAEGYVSLDLAGFRMPEGIEATGDFEMGFNLPDCYLYDLTNLERSRFALEAPPIVYGDFDNPPDTISDNRLVLFSSEMLRAGFPDIMEEWSIPR